MALSLQPKEGLGSSVAGGGDIRGLLSPTSPPWGCVGLSVAWSPPPGCRSVPVPSGSPPGRGGVGHRVQHMWWHYGTRRGSPTPWGPPTSPAVTAARQAVSPGCPRTGSRVSPAQEGAHPMEDHVVLHRGTRCPSHRDHGDLTGSCIERARRAWRGTGTPRPWRADGCGDTLGTETGAEQVTGDSPRGQRGGHTPTFPHAGQGQGELAHEVVAGGAVVVLHHEAHQGQLGRPQLEAQRLLPARVEAYGTGTGGGHSHRGHRGHRDHLPPASQGLA